MKEGDKNTTFFQCMAKAGKRINFISKFHRGSGFTSVPEEVKEEIACYFEKLYASDAFLRPTLERCLSLSFPFPMVIDCG